MVNLNAKLDDWNYIVAAKILKITILAYPLIQIPKTVFHKCVALKKAVLFRSWKGLFRACVFGNSFCSFTEQHALQVRQEVKTNRSLNFSWRDGWLFVMVCKFRCFSSNSFERSLTNEFMTLIDLLEIPNIGMNLFENLCKCKYHSFAFPFFVFSVEIF